MKKYFYILAALSMAPTFSLAQSLESDVDAELDAVYAPQEAAAQPAPAPQAGISSTAPVTGGQPIYILNQATPSSTAQVQQSQPQIQKQPTTYIEASPLSESRAEQIRKARQDAELQTEQRIVEKLESARMEDEKKRANVLFGDKFNQLQEGQQQQQPVQVQQQPVQPVYVQPAPVIPTQTVVEPKENTRDIVREEIAAAMKAEQDAAVGPVETKYIGGILGIGDYPDTANVKGNYALGVAFGSKFDNIVLEGSFLYSQYAMQSPQYVREIDVNQYTGALAAKIQLFNGVIKPVFGGVVAYSYRTFSFNNNYNTMYGGGYSPYASNYNNSTGNSHAIDIGTVVGADLEFSPKYSLGLDFRYMWNLSSRRNIDNTYLASPYANYTPIEKLQYYVMSLVGRVNF